MKTIQFGIAKKIVTLTSLLVLLSSLGLGLIFYVEGKQYLIERDLKTLEEDVSLFNQGFQSHIDILKENVIFLTGTPPIQGIIRARKGGGVDPRDGSTEKVWRQRLAVIFQKFLRAKPDYYQIRYIGIADEGKEIVRVDRIGNVVNTVLDKDLQSKAHRDYFKESVSLRRGQVYLSNITLNREYGKVSRPHMPILRGAVPIYDEDGEVFGIFVLSLDLRSFLKDPSPSRFQFFVTNHHGDFLAHPNPALTFGFDLGKRYRIQDFYPEMGVFFEPRNATQKETLFFENNAGGQDVVSFAKMRFDDLHPERFLGLVMAETYQSLIAGSATALYQFGLVIVAVVLTALGLTLIFARRLTRPIDQIIRAGEDLAQGKENIYFPTHLKDELGFLATSLADMDRKVRERTRKLKASEEQIRLITDNVLEGLVTLDEKGIVQSFNPSAERIFGYQAEEIIGRNVKELMPEPDRSKHDEYIQNYLKTGETKIIGISRELVGLRKDGSVFPMDLGVSEMHLHDGDSQGTKLFVGTVRDISDRKKTERASQAKSEFLSKMSHELRTPLNAILGFSQLMAMNPESNLNDVEKQNVEQIHKAGNHLLKLINEILDLSRIESGKIELSMEPVNLDRVLADTISAITPFAEERPVRLINESSGGSGHWVWADHVRLKQVLLNLISNAIKYNKKNGTVSFSIEETGNDALRIAITDTGIGIPEEKQLALFEPFNRLNADDSEVEGTGIGLSIAKQLTELMGGKIGVNSTVGEGSCFFIEMPRCEPVQGIQDESLETLKEFRASSNVTPAEFTVLYVEDNPANLELVKQVLSFRPNIKLHTAVKGWEGVEMAKSCLPDLILLDINLPDIDGTEVFKNLQKYESTRGIPVFALSANAMREDIRKVMDMGFKDYIVKPIVTRELLEKLDRFSSSLSMSAVTKSP